MFASKDMSDVSIPSFDPANAGTLQGVVDEAIKRAMVGLEIMLPATVISYDRTNNVASVQPQILMVATDGSTEQRAPVASVPVLALGGGGWLITFPLPAGSKGWIKASDRDISLYMQSGGMTAPNTARLHSFSDSMFIPDFTSGYTLSAEDVANNMVIQSADHTKRIALWPDRIRITTPILDVNCPQINFTTAPNIGPLVPTPTP
jgi:hypothetical protein